MAAKPKQKVDSEHRSAQQKASLAAAQTVQNGATAGQLDNLIHERSRLAIISTLAVHERLSFSELKELLELSDGNLSVQARKLEEAGYLSCHKQFVGRTPRTEFTLTDSGQAALQRYVSHMEALIRAMKQE
ncbi:transcriptional regulator [Pseudohongiella sp. SYSU M77423]|uniref:winged helix-turn-helix domain-containing protein n=1 Tax=Pseudohongiella sp. SYSU M77423 TaxID=3042312 RepID=UPI0024807F3A|nr:transcriptional regulator [Pseudohongiella sp. SYSU M77423]MDH7943352.1 transcriptional regulator [Pseudohongiella sp. SYSU M77423]